MKKSKRLKLWFLIHVFFEVGTLVLLLSLLKNNGIKLGILIVWIIRISLFCYAKGYVEKNLQVKGRSDSSHCEIKQETPLENEREQAKYLALQNQINPHFLYNTLEGIRSEALLSGVPTAAKMSELLANFFRYNISNVDKMVTIEDELRNIKNYFKIQQFRFGDRIRMQVIFEEDEEMIKKVRTPKLILQPIIENAIMHGLEPLIAQGKITIRFMVYDTRLLLIVSDSGVGISEAKLEEINQKLRGVHLEESSELKKGGIGMVNVNNRIQLLFGAAYGLRVYSKERVGTDVEISLPFQVRG